MPWLEWLDRQQDIKKSGKVPYRLLQPVHGLDCGEADSLNLMLEGDNLAGMKALLPYYGGQVQCCYMDPPYNTENIFRHYDDNLEHSIWLSSMYPRLELARKLLAETGFMFVSIDDQEGHYLKVIMDEIFGRKNFVATFIWQKVDSPNDNKPAITPDHEFILCYAKDKTKAHLRKLGDTSVLDAYPRLRADDLHGPRRRRLWPLRHSRYLRRHFEVDRFHIAQAAIMPSSVKKRLGHGVKFTLPARHVASAN